MPGYQFQHAFDQRRLVIGLFGDVPLGVPGLAQYLACPSPVALATAISASLILTGNFAGNAASSRTSSVVPADTAADFAAVFCRTPSLSGLFAMVSIPALTHVW